MGMLTLLLHLDYVLVLAATVFLELASKVKYVDPPEGTGNKKNGASRLRTHGCVALREPLTISEPYAILVAYGYQYRKTIHHRLESRTQAGWKAVGSCGPGSPHMLRAAVLHQRDPSIALQLSRDEPAVHQVTSSS